LKSAELNGARALYSRRYTPIKKQNPAEAAWQSESENNKVFVAQHDLSCVFIDKTFLKNCL
jgi:hypothetical protein